MKTRILKWGNSLALRIPKSFADDIGLEMTSPVEMHIEKGKLILMPVKEKKYSLEELLSQINEANIHDEVDTGNSIGKETW